MKNKKQLRAEYLLSELSGVDDRYLVAALQTQGQQKSHAFHRVLLIAACLSLSFVLAVSVFLLTRRAFDQSDKKNPNNQGEAVPGTSEPATVWELDGVLNDADGASAIRIAKEDLDFFSDECYVIWQYQGDSYYYRSRPLTEREQRTLRSSAADSLQAPVANADQPEVRIWIVEADGTVWTPYLQYTDGNLAAAELFDYQTEVVPSNDMISCISKLLNSGHP